MTDLGRGNDGGGGGLFPSFPPPSGNLPARPPTPVSPPSKGLGVVRGLGAVPVEIPAAERGYDGSGSAGMTAAVADMADFPLCRA